MLETNGWAISRIRSSPRNANRVADARRNCTQLRNNRESVSEKPAIKPQAWTPVIRSSCLICDVAVSPIHYGCRAVRNSGVSLSPSLSLSLSPSLTTLCSLRLREDCVLFSCELKFIDTLENGCENSRVPIMVSSRVSIITIFQAMDSCLYLRKEKKGRRERERKFF